MKLNAQTNNASLYSATFTPKFHQQVPMHAWLCTYNPLDIQAMYSIQFQHSDFVDILTFIDNGDIPK